jgi:spore germination protein YaaH
MRSSRASSVVATAAVVGVLAASSSAAPGGLAVLGFQSDYSPARLVDTNATALTLVGVDGVNLNGPGTVTAPTAADRRQLAHAHAHALPAVLLVANWSNKLNDFSEPLAHQTLGSAQRTDAAATALANAVGLGGWDGVSVDLEALAPRDTAGLTRFVSDLRADLPGGDSLTVCLTAATSTPAYASMGYDLPALAASADQIVLMTYDDHGPWEKTPGPIGPLRWQRASVKALEHDVPAGQIFLGVANYAYAWRPDRVDSLTVAQARRLAHRLQAHPRWIASAGEWRAKLRDGSTLWWSDKRSMRARWKLARTLGVHGVAVWSLGSGDPLP